MKKGHPYTFTNLKNGRKRHVTEYYLEKHCRDSNFEPADNVTKEACKQFLDAQPEIRKERRAN